MEKYSTQNCTPKQITLRKKSLERMEINQYPFTAFTIDSFDLEFDLHWVGRCCLGAGFLPSNLNHGQTRWARWSQTGVRQHLE